MHFPAPGTYELQLSKNRSSRGRDGMVAASVFQPVPLGFQVEIKEDEKGRRIELPLPTTFF